MGAVVKDEVIADMPIRALVIWCDGCGQEIVEPTDGVFLIRETDRQIWFAHAPECSNSVFHREHPSGGGLLEAFLDYIGIY